MNDIINQEILSFVHAYINKRLPCVFDDYFNHRFSIDTYIASERKIRFIIPRFYTDIGGDAINVKGAQLWNELKLDVKPNVPYKVFKNLIKTP